MLFIGLLTFVFFMFKKTKVEYSKYAKVEVKNPKYDFGEIYLKDTINHNFILKNISDNIFYISKVLSGCGCTSVEYEKKIIQNGDEIIIKTQFIANETKLGKSKNIIIVEGNSEQGIIRLELNGIVKK